MKKLTSWQGLALLSGVAAMSSWFSVLEQYMHPSIAALIWLVGMLWVLNYFGLLKSETSE